MLTLDSIGSIATPSPIAIVSVLVFLGLYVGVVVYCINDLYKPERRVNGGNKDMWAVIIVLFSILGIFAYLYYGREI